MSIDVLPIPIPLSICLIGVSYQMATKTTSNGSWR